MKSIELITDANCSIFRALVHQLHIQDRHHAWRTPVLASTGIDGNVNARTVVLRKVDFASQTLEIYTDRRSPKVQELSNKPTAIFVFWSARLAWQLRVRVSFANQVPSSHVKAQWLQVMQTARANDYLEPLPPGSPCTEVSSAHTLLEKGDNFALLISEVLEIDWLELGRAGHRRARMLQDTWQWLTP